MEEEHPDSTRGVRQGWGGIMDLQNNLDRGPCPTSSLSDENQNRLTENGQDEMDGSLQTGRTPCLDQTSDGSHGGEPLVPGPSPSPVAFLQNLTEHSDYTLLPQCLHQIAEDFFLEENYEWAVQFLQLERDYHQRLLSNLARLQEHWGITHFFFFVLLFVAGGADAGEMSSAGPNWLGEEKEETGSSMEPADSEGAEGGEEKPEIVEVEVSEESNELEDNGYGVDVAGDGQAQEAGEAPHDSLDDLAKRIQVEEITPASGLVSILKRRTSPEVSSAPAPPKQTSKRKVRFRELDEVPDQDEVGGGSWLLLLLLCLATVVVSVGGTALYCALGDVQSSVCTDFSRNVDFYFSQAQRGLDELRHWLSPGPL
uniref:Consortin, connexin sorting protein a n=1 Tax=Paramormyrops kingsleyae TaxID=1676925 RepID=A0A3B3RYH4_9TELE